MTYDLDTRLEGEDMDTEETLDFLADDADFDEPEDEDEYEVFVYLAPLYVQDTANVGQVSV